VSLLSPILSGTGYDCCCRRPSDGNDDGGKSEYACGEKIDELGSCQIQELEHPLKSMRLLESYC